MGLEFFRSQGEHHFSRDEIADARAGLEKLSARIDKLRSKKKLTPEERREMDLIINNAAILEEIARKEDSRESKNG